MNVAPTTDIAPDQYTPAPPSMEAYPPGSATAGSRVGHPTEYQPAASSPIDHGKGYQPMNPIAQPPPSYRKFSWPVFTIRSLDVIACMPTVHSWHVESYMGGRRETSCRS